jgi:hypothetical protein
MHSKEKDQSALATFYRMGIVVEVHELQIEDKDFHSVQVTVYLAALYDFFRLR